MFLNELSESSVVYYFSGAVLDFLEAKGLGVNITTSFTFYFLLSTFYYFFLLFWKLLVCQNLRILTFVPICEKICLF